MNIETANRLVELRKLHNLSQEDLAEQIGISRQAISKWERAEASPDTDNLISLARLYNISLDELLGNAMPVVVPPPPAQEEAVRGNPLTRTGFPMWFVILLGVIAFGVVALFLSFFWAKIHALYPILCVITFLILGFRFNKWHPSWMIFLSIPVFYILF